MTKDVVAWDVEMGRVATMLGAATMLGEDQLTAPRVGDGLQVYPDVADWLRADRSGIVILDAERARWRLAKERLIVADAMFGRLLREALRLPEHQIFVDRVGRAAA